MKNKQTSRRVQTVSQQTTFTVKSDKQKRATRRKLRQRAKSRPRDENGRFTVSMKSLLARLVLDKNAIAQSIRDLVTAQAEAGAKKPQARSADASDRLTAKRDVHYR